MATKMRFDPILLCQDKAIGHRWDPADARWEEGPDIKRGRRTIYVHHRVMACPRCQSQRIEIFDQVGDGIAKRAHGGNRYRYSKAYKERDRLAPSEIHTEIWRKS